MEKYFTGLNYSLANEDNLIERHLVLQSTKAIAVCGSGTRALTLLHDTLKELTVIDISQAQLDYARFKYELIKTMSYHDYITFMGLQPANLIDRISIFKSYQHGDWARQYYQEIPKDVLAEGLVYSGRWESFLIKLGKVITALTGYEDFFLDFQDKDHAKKFWPEKRLRFLVNSLAHPVILNKFLYKGQMINLEQHHLGDFLLNNFKQNFFAKDPRNSFFHQMLFLGKIVFPQAYPLEFQQHVFDLIKSFKGTVQFLRKDLIKAVEEQNFDFASLSNTATYFDTKNKLQFEQALLKVLSKKEPQKIILRSFLRPDPIKLDQLKTYIDFQQSLIAEQQDSTLLYKFQILKNM